jgi:hypothetical protein
VIDVSYSAFIAGMFSGVTDGVNVPDDVNGKTFPYLAPPQ